MTSSRTRLLLASGAAVAALVLRVLALLLEPAGAEGSTTQQVAGAAAHPIASYVSIWSEMLSWQLAALACLTVTGLVLRGRGHTLTVVGGWLNAVSMMYLGFGLTFAFADIDLARLHQDARTVQDLHAIGTSPAIVPVFGLLMLGLVFPVVQAVGLARGRVVGWWYVGLTVADAVVYLVTTDSQSKPVQLLGLVPLAAILLTWTWLLRRAADRAPAVTSSATVEPALA